MLFGSGLAGLALGVLAMRRKLQVLFVVWTLAVFLVLLRGYFLSGYSFAFGRRFHVAVLVVLGALAALAGSVLQVRREVQGLKQRSASA